MAKELKLVTTLTYTPTDDNQHKIEIPTITQIIDMTGSDHIEGTWNVGTSEEILLGADISTVTAVGTIGWVCLTNLDTANFVQFASDTFGVNYPLRLNAGETCVFRMGAVNGILRGLADTAAVDVQYYIFET